MVENTMTTKPNACVSEFKMSLSLNAELIKQLHMHFCTMRRGQGEMWNSHFSA